MEKITLLAEYELGFVYISIFAMKFFFQMVSANMGTARRTTRVNNPDQHIYRVYGGPANGSTVLMDCDHATSIIDVSGTVDGQLVQGLKFTNFCGLQTHTSKMQLAAHNRDVWQEEQARAVKARPRFQPLMEIDNPRRGRLPTRPAMSRSSPVAFCYSAARHGQTAMELLIKGAGEGKDQQKQHGILSWCFMAALGELQYECTHLQLMEAIQRRMRQIKDQDLPKLDQEVLLTFSTPLSNPSRMKALHPVELQHAARQLNGGGVGGEPSWASQPALGAPAVVPPPPKGLVGPEWGASEPQASVRETTSESRQ